MPLVEVRRAIYSYTPAAEDELSLKDGDVLYILDNDDPDWLEAKKKQFNIDDPMEQGLVPANHTEPVASIARAKALYDYEPVENEETTLAEGEDVLIIEEDDPDWFMTKSNGGYGFIPKAYVEIVSRDTPAKTVDSETPMDDHLPPPQIPAAELSPPAPPTLPQQLPPAPPTLPPQPPQLPPAPPALPKIAQPAAPISPQVAHSAPMSPMASAQPAETISHFNVVEGKKKKKGTMVTLGISNTTFVVDSRNDAVAPKKFAMGDVTKCTAKKGVLGVEIGGYAPAAFDFTCASNAEAESIMDAVNAARRGTFVGKKHVDAAGLPIPPATAQRDRTASIASSANKPLPPHPRAPTTGEYARVLYDFSSEDPEELTVSEGARVLVLDKSDPEWWQVQLEAPNGPTGLVPSAYVGPPYPHAPNSPTASAIDHVFMSAASTAAAAAPLPPPPPPPPQAPPLELHGYGDMPPLPARTETVRKAASEAHSAEQTKNTYVPPPAATAALPGPDMNKVRTWTDGSGAYTVEAQFLSLDSQNNVNLHKTNGKKINVPLSKFAPVDREYVYRVTGNAPEQPPKPQTARQRQLESARKTPGTRIINYDWDWFDFFTLKAGISADSALKYATSFVAERLDDQSIPEIDASLMNQLGVKQHDVSNIQRAFRVHQGLPGESTASQISDMFATSSAPAPIQDAQGISRRIAPDRPAPGMPTVDLLDATMEPPRLPARSPTTANAPASPVQPKVDNNPWGMDSNLDRRVGQRQQIEDDEALARRLQQEEKDNAKRDKKPHFWNRHANDSKNTKPDPFSSLDGPSGSSSGGYQRTGTAAASTTGGGSKQPLNLASGSRKNNKTQISFVDPSQLRSAQQKLSGQTSPRVSSPLLDTSSSSARGAAAIDQAFGLSSGSPRSPVYNPPPRARPTARQQQSQPQQQQASTAIPTSPQNTSASGFGELTTNRMAAATASGNTAQIDQLERMAKAREQELAAQEARLKQQQEEIRKQAMFLQQQQQNLLQMQQSQKVEAQLKQLKEEKDRLEQQRQAEELKKQVDILRSQQQQMLKMQQMATQARGAMAAGGSISQPQTVSGLSGMATSMAAGPALGQQQQQLALQQQQQQTVPLSSRLPPPLVPSRVSKPITTPQPNQLAQQNQQQQQIGSNANVFATNGMFGVSQGITNIPAASTSSAGLTAVPARGIFSNHAVAGSTPNLGSFANTKPLLNAPVGVGNANGIGSGYSNNIAATHSVTNFGTFNNNMQGTPQQQQQQQMNQFMQQKQLMMSSNGQQFNATANKYDIFKSVNPHGPSVFTGDVQQNLMLGNVNTQQQLMPNNALGGNVMPAGFVMNNQSQQQQSSGPRPMGIFAMANPTLSQPQQQQAGLQQNMFQNQAFGAQQGQQQQPQQQMFGMNQQSGNVNGFGGQVQWR